MSDDVRKVTTLSPSFPAVVPDELLPAALPATVWQVLCGDAGHWRVGVYSPAASAAAELVELERHDCPELFCLLSGQLTLVLWTPQGLREVPLLPQRPVLVEAPHWGFCPAGPHTGQALVVERDAFGTEYRSPSAWAALAADEG